MLYFTKFAKSGLTNSGSQNILPPKMLLIDNFELKAIEKWQMQDGVSALLLSTQK